MEIGMHARNKFTEIEAAGPAARPLEFTWKLLLQKSLNSIIIIINECFFHHKYHHHLRHLLPTEVVAVASAGINTRISIFIKIMIVFTFADGLRRRSSNNHSKLTLVPRHKIICFWRSIF